MQALATDLQLADLYVITDHDILRPAILRSYHFVFVEIGVQTIQVCSVNVAWAVTYLNTVRGALVCIMLGRRIISGWVVGR